MVSLNRSRSRNDAVVAAAKALVAPSQGRRSPRVKLSYPRTQPRAVYRAQQGPAAPSPLKVSQWRTIPKYAAPESVTQTELHQRNSRGAVTLIAGPHRKWELGIEGDGGVTNARDARPTPDRFLLQLRNQHQLACNSDCSGRICLLGAWVPSLG